MSVTEEAERDYTFRLNFIADKWGSATRKDLLGSARGAGIRAPATKLRLQKKMDSGRVEAISFSFPRYLVFVEMGVFGGLSIEEARSQGKLDPREWYNPALEKNLPNLEKQILDMFPDLVVKSTKLKIRKAT